MRIKIKYTLILIPSLMALFGGASLQEVRPDILDPSTANLLRYFLIMVGFAGILFCSLLLQRERSFSYQRNILLFSVWLCFGFSSLITSVWKYEWMMILNSFWFLLGVPIIFFYIFPILIGAFSLDVILRAFFFSHLPYLVLSILYSQALMPGGLYAGIFKNPNEFGMIAADLLIGAGYFFYSAYEKGKKTKSVFWFLLSSLFVVFIVLSGSRTSLAAAGCFMACVFFLLKGNAFRKASVLFPFLLLLGAIYFISPDILHAIQIKFFQSGYSTSLLTNRETIWAAVLQDVSWAGHSPDYFDVHLGIGSHNSFLEILALYGPLACFFLVLVFPTAVFVFFTRRAFLNGQVKFAFLSVFSMFFVLSCAEGMLGALGGGIQLLFFTMLGVIGSRVENTVVLPREKDA